MLFLGDMNVQIKGPRCDPVNDTRVRNVAGFLHDTQMLSINVQELCSGPRFTFQPYDLVEKRTMVDHVIAPLCLSVLFTSCEIAGDHELNTSDHRPIISHLSVTVLCHKRCKFTRIRYKWNKFSPQTISESYGVELCKLLCYARGPSTTKSINDIDEYNRSLVTSMQCASAKTLPKSSLKKHIKPR